MIDMYIWKYIVNWFTMRHTVLAMRKKNYFSVYYIYYYIYSFDYYISLLRTFKQDASNITPTYTHPLNYRTSYSAN